MATVIVNGPTIAAGESLSSALDCSQGNAIAVAIPATWKSALLTFQLSPDGQFFGDLFDRSAKEVAVNVMPGTVVQIDPDSRLGSAWVKFRSGSRHGPVVQTEQQDFKIFLDRPGN
jgi:hypothetical protein